MDVFGKLNDFLNNGEESFKYDDFDDNDVSVTKEDMNDTKESQKSVSSDDSALKLRRSKRSRESNSQPSNTSSEEILDMTELYPSHHGKSRKKMADELPVVVKDSIDITDSPSVSSPVVGSTRGRGRGRGGKKAKAPRLVSYKKALECLNVPIVDLLDSPALPVPSTVTRPSNRSNSSSIDLTGDVEMTEIHNKNPLFQKAAELPKNTNKKYDERYGLDFEEGIDQIRINVRIKNQLRKYYIGTSQHFYELFRMIAEDEDIPLSNVVCFLGEKRIYPEDTPHSIGHRISNIYTCRLIDFVTTATANKKDMIDIKFQSDKWKKPITLKVNRFEPFKMHIQQLCKEVTFQPEQFTLKFDGDDIDVKKSPIELEFEGGEIIDCRIKA